MSPHEELVNGLLADSRDVSATVLFSWRHLARESPEKAAWVFQTDLEISRAIPDAPTAFLWKLSRSPECLFPPSQKTLSFLRRMLLARKYRNQMIDLLPRFDRGRKPD